MTDSQTIDRRPMEAAAMPLLRAGRAPGGKPKFAYIDCLRGYAVLMVMICHATYAIPELPYPVHRLGVFGWFGVQLFFLASCITLMMSAQYEQGRIGHLHVGDFFIRRFLRIAPMFYLAAALYWIIAPSKDASLEQLLASLAFVNAWHPVTTTTTGGWQVVPGSWSVGVEFTFYFLFPFFVSLISSFRRAAFLLVAMLLLGAALNSYLTPLFTAQYGKAAADNFLYFWFFNQAPVFVLGAMAFFSIRAVERQPAGWIARSLRHSRLALAIGPLLLFIVAAAPLPFGNQLMLRFAVPQYLAVSVAFFIFILAMSQAERTILINPVIAAIGKVSFSAYLLHFAVIQLMLEDHPGLFHLGATGWTAIAIYPFVTLAVIVVTCLCSAVTYTLIEKPMMDWAKKLTRHPAVARRAMP
jgi:peptidoglycan/LPS O-acetylase OafA/YrhL